MVSAKIRLKESPKIDTAMRSSMITGAVRYMPDRASVQHNRFEYLLMTRAGWTERMVSGIDSSRTSTFPAFERRAQSDYVSRRVNRGVCLRRRDGARIRDDHCVRIRIVVVVVAPMVPTRIPIILMCPEEGNRKLHHPALVRRIRILCVPYDRLLSVRRQRD